MRKAAQNTRGQRVMFHRQARSASNVVEDKLNFSQIAALIVDADHYSTNILSQILRGFGLTRHNIIESAEGAKLLLQKDHYDLVICEAVLPDMPAAEFVRWIRIQPTPAVKFIPVVMLTGYTQFSNVTAARDSGANSVVRKPVAPTTLFDHMAWSARTDRPFVETRGYSGPCRRFKYEGPPCGVGRREADQAAETHPAASSSLPPEKVASLANAT